MKRILNYTIFVILEICALTGTCISQVGIVRSQLFEKNGNVIIGPSSVDGHYPDQPLFYINNYNLQTDLLWEYIADIQEEIDAIQSKRIKNPKKLKKLKLNLKKTQLEIELLSEIISLWQEEQKRNYNFYSMFNIKNEININCYKFVTNGDTINGDDLKVIVNNSESKRVYYEIINDKTFEVSGKLSEQDEINYNQLINGRGPHKFHSINMEIVDYEITEVELNSLILRFRSLGYENDVRQLREIDDSELIQRIERHYPSFIFDYEIVEMYKEIHYETKKEFIQLYVNNSGLQIIPDMWIKINCE